MPTPFQTEVEVPDFKWKTGYKKRNLFLGSCFTEHIGGKMATMKFPVDINPFGILYNPASVAGALRMLKQEKHFSEKDLIHHKGLWHSILHHSRFSSPEPQTTLDKINSRIKTSARFLREADFLFLTFGTAWIYEYKKTGQTAANCHKIPAREFSRSRLTPGEISGEYSRLLSEIWTINPSLIVIFTVSPIRHWKDGPVENQRSKAALILAIDQIVKTFGRDRCDYFPAYEIVMDELRNYRFYEEDMIHLSPAAVNHIWEKFQTKLIDGESRKISGEIQKIIRAMNHRPFNKYIPEHQVFLKQSLRKTKSLKEKFSYLNLTIEEQYFLNQLKETENKKQE